MMKAHFVASERIPRRDAIQRNENYLLQTPGRLTAAIGVTRFLQAATLG
jgi:hypothetical protein